MFRRFHNAKQPAAATPGASGPSGYPVPLPETEEASASYPGPDAASVDLVAAGVGQARAGNRNRAAALLKQAAVTNHPALLCDIGSYLLAIEHRDAAYACYVRAADAGNLAAMHNAGVLSKEDGRLDEAQRWWTAAVDGGYVGSMNSLGNLVRLRHNDITAGMRYYRLAAAAGVPDAMLNLVPLLAGAGEIAEARHWAEALTATGNPAGPLMSAVVDKAEGRDPAPVATAPAAPREHTPILLDLVDPLGSAERLRRQVAADADPEVLDAALVTADWAVESAGGAAEPTAAAQSIRCVLLRTRAQRTRDPADLTASIAAGRAAVAASEASGTYRSRAAGALASALLDSHQRQPDPVALAEAVRYDRIAVNTCDGDDSERAAALSNLVNALVLSHHQSGTLAPVAEAARHARAAVELIEPTSFHFPGVAMTCAQAMWKLCLATKNLLMFDEARRLARAAAQAVPADHPNRPAIEGFAALLDEAAERFDQA